ncbi:MAG: hypothetical protein JXQ27_15225 [Acidobacteria bacterium]|nr:hypothetical protein [Acidobacteriota bacterium]
MPFIISHILFACRRTPFSLWDPTLFVAAQGPDPYFYLLNRSAAETGRAIHRIAPGRWDSLLADFPPAFRHGFQAHLELDDRLHPHIRRAVPDGLIHTHLEVTLDDILCRRHLGRSLLDLQLWQYIRTPELDDLSDRFRPILAAAGHPEAPSYATAVRAMSRNLRRLYHRPALKRGLNALLRLVYRDFAFMYPGVEDFSDEQLRPYLDAFTRLLTW